MDSLNARGEAFKKILENESQNFSGEVSERVK
jgi:hypothetical protein